MDQPLSGDRLTEERAYMKRFSEGLAGHPVQYPADYSTPLEDGRGRCQRAGGLHLTRFEIC